MKLFKASCVLVAAATAAIWMNTANAQVQSSTDTKEGASTKAVSVERGEVLMVDGNDLFVKMDDGQVRHFPNISESARVEVDGQQVGIHDLKPGMKLQRELTVTTTPRMVTQVQTVTGKIFHVTPPITVILTMDNGQNQSFKIPKDQKFNVHGEMVDAFHLKKGMVISATKVTEVPETVVAHERKVTGTMPPPPPAPPPADAPVLLVETTHVTPAAEPTQTAAVEPAPQELPKTGTEMPLIGLIGLAALAAAGGMRLMSARLFRHTD
jgi:LPXTG-motif cell wall-anchored protein